MERNKRMSFKEGNKVVKEYVEKIKKSADVLAKGHDNVMGFIASTNSADGTVGKAMTFVTNVTTMDLTKTLINVGEQNEAFMRAMQLAVVHFNEHPPVKKKKSIGAMLMDVFGKGSGNADVEIEEDGISIKMGGAIRVHNGKAEMVGFDEIPDEVAEELARALGELGVGLNNRKKEKEVAIAPKVEKPKKKTIKMKDLLTPKKAAKKKK